MRGQRLHRLLQLIAILRGPTSYNARRLAERFGCSRRNVYRDMAVLELAGVPIYHDPDFGEGGGYRVRSDWWFPSVGLTDRECLDLAVVARVAETQTIPLLDEVGSARDKLLGTLPVKQQDLIRTAAELFDVLGLGVADHSHCRAVMTSLQTALLTQRQVGAVYRTPYATPGTTPDTTSDAEADAPLSMQRERAAPATAQRLHLQPRRIFLAGQAWYLAAWCNRADANRLYRVARFERVEVGEEPIDVDGPLSLRELLGNAWTVRRGDRDFHLRVRFHPPAAELVAETRWHHTQSVTREDDGSAVLEATVSGLDEVKYWVLGWGPLAEVLQPIELRAEVARLLRDALHHYPEHTTHD